MTCSGDQSEPARTRWNAELYESQHSFVWKCASDLLELLAPQCGESILDLGCGTGHLSSKIASSGAEVLGIDSSPSMIAQARDNFPQVGPELRFEVGDARSFHFPEPFDAVFSNAALHWVREPEQVAASVWKALRRGGRFVAEFGGLGNVREISAALHTSLRVFASSPSDAEVNPWYFPSVGEYAALLERHGLLVTYAMLVDRPTALNDGERGMQHWIEMFGGAFLEVVPPAKHADFIRDVEDRLRPKLHRDGVWFADYRRLRVVATREEIPGV